LAIRKIFFTFALLAGVESGASGAAAPPTEAFVVLPAQPNGPRITPYLQYQTELAWRQDEERQKVWSAIRTEQDLLRIQGEVRKKLLTMLGGLPDRRTPLRPRVTDRIPMDGFHIEKVIFESLPGLYVTALLYVPGANEPGTRGKQHPAILVPAGHAANGKDYYQALCQRLVQRG